MDPFTFLEGVYRAHGGLVERQDGVLTALAPLGSPLTEAVEVWTGAPEHRPAHAELLHPGHPALDSAMRLALGSGRLGLRHVVVPPTRRARLADLARRTFGFRNARLHLHDERPTVIPWATFHFHVTFSWDEKREDLVSIPLDLHSGARVPLERLSAAWVEPGGLAGADRSGLERGLASARRHLEDDLGPRIRALREQVARHAEVEQARLASYYEGILGDLQRRMRSASEDRMPGLRGKHAQTEAEWAVRRAEAQEKHRLRIEVHLSCLELVDIPRVLLPATVSAGRVRQEVVLSYDRLTHEFDPLACAGCLGPTHVVWLCGEGHLACPACHRPCSACGRPSCGACPGERCGDCGGMLCAECASCVTDCRRRSSSGERPAVSAAGGGGGKGADSSRERPGVGEVAADRTGSGSLRPLANGRSGVGDQRVATASRPVREPAPPPTDPDVALLQGLFADLIQRYADLAGALAPTLADVETRRFRMAAERLAELEFAVSEEHAALRERIRRVASCLRSSNPAEARSRLRKLLARLEPQIRQSSAPPPSPGSQGAGRPRPPARPGARSHSLGPALSAAVSIARAVLPEVGGPPGWIDRVVQLLESRADVIQRRDCDPAGWAAAAAWLLSRGRQADVGAWFGVSASVVSQRSGEIRRSRGG